MDFMRAVVGYYVLGKQQKRLLIELDREMVQTEPCLLGHEVGYLLYRLVVKCHFLQVDLTQIGAYLSHLIQHCG